VENEGFVCVQITPDIVLKSHPVLYFVFL